jgi:hypothetical protein
LPVTAADGFYVPGPEELRRLYPDGSLMGSYRVRETTNYGDLRLPSQFELIYFNDRNFTNSARSRLSIVGSLSRVGVLTASDFVPQVSGRLGVIDYRVEDFKTHAPPVRYSVLNGNWPDENSLRRKNLERAAAIHKGLIVIVVLGCLSLGVGYVLITKARLPGKSSGI